MSAASFCTPTPGGPCCTHPARSRAASPATASRPPNRRSVTGLGAEEERRFELGHCSTVVLLPGGFGAGGAAFGAGRLAEERGQLRGVGVAQRQAGDDADGPDRRGV